MPYKWKMHNMWLFTRCVLSITLSTILIIKRYCVKADCTEIWVKAFKDCTKYVWDPLLLKGQDCHISPVALSIQNHMNSDHWCHKISPRCANYSFTDYLHVHTDTLTYIHMNDRYIHINQKHTCIQYIHQYHHLFYTNQIFIYSNSVTYVHF